MSICDDCIHDDVCGLEDNHEEGIVSCADRIPKNVLDKIKAEIEKKHTRAKQINSVLQMNAYIDCLQIIDKYKAESEGKE